MTFSRAYFKSFSVVHRHYRMGLVLFLLFVTKKEVMEMTKESVRKLQEENTATQKIFLGTSGPSPWWKDATNESGT